MPGGKFSMCCTYAFPLTVDCIVHCSSWPCVHTRLEHPILKPTYNCIANCCVVIRMSNRKKILGWFRFGFKLLQFRSDLGKLKSIPLHGLVQWSALYSWPLMSPPRCTQATIESPLCASFYLEELEGILLAWWGTGLDFLHFSKHEN